ncbi:ComG operon protein 2 [Companilactobacillus kimchiensis]|uniref:ComG operon protein 2 n=1 Tax=Companilactobacillus kimchiensis TaxID=993692 RepID=A0A0R2LAW2_9LACO|nr:ComG operon protein 2 [Companilactobacillus kimchiensis]
MRLLKDNDELFEKIHRDLQSGKMISQALIHLQLPTVVFNQLVIAQNHGKIEVALEQTGLLLQSQAKQKNKLKEILMYPSFILGFLMTMLIGMKIYIIPQLEVASGGNNIDLLLKALLLLFVISITLLMIFIFRIRQKSEYQQATVLVKLPAIGKIYLNFYQFLMLQGLGMQLSSGMNLFDICESNKHFQKGSIQNYLANKFIVGLTSGKNLLTMIEEEIFLPKQLKVILQAGESGSQLAQDLLLMSELKFEETQRELKKLLNLVQPILFGVIAIVIVVTYLIVLLPIYGMMRGMS